MSEISGRKSRLLNEGVGRYIYGNERGKQGAWWAHSWATPASTTPARAGKLSPVPLDDAVLARPLG